MAKDEISKILDFIFRKNHAKYLLLLFVIAFILRSIAALNIAPNADEMLHATHAIDIIKANVLQIMDQDPVWFYMTDIGFRIFGVNMFSGRFLSILFGSLSIFPLYLLGKELFNRRIGLIASVILTFSPFYMNNTLAEMDVAMTFFILLSSYFFIVSLKKENYKLLLTAVIFFGIAILVKTIAASFLPAFVIYYIYYLKKNKIKWLTWKRVIIPILILFILLTPIFSFNYLLYKDKGIVDVQFSRFLGISPEVYAGISSTMKPFSVSDLFFTYEDGLHPPGYYEGFRMYWKQGLVTFLLGILGFFLAFKKNRSSLLFLSLLFFFPFTFLSGTSLLPYHFVFGIPIFAISGGLFINWISIKISKPNKFKVMSVILVLVIFSSFFFMNQWNAFSGKNEITKMFEFSEENIPDEALVLVDSRIYRGRIAWLFNDKHYLESGQLNSLLETSESLLDSVPLQQRNPVSVETYFVECIIDDCGWGNVDAALNQSMEQTIEFIRNSSREVGVVTNNKNDPYFRVYQTKLNLRPITLALVDQTHVWFYYPVRYKYEEQIFDKYETHGFFDTALDGFAHLILYLTILIALSSILISIFIVYKDYKKQTK